MNRIYYRRFSIFTTNPLWRLYLKYAYRQSRRDLETLRCTFHHERVGFTALLCGTSGYATSACFIKYILNNNSRARIHILDASAYPLEETRSKVEIQFPGAGISYHQGDALNLPFADHSIDYIETDAFLQFFAPEKLPLLLQEWVRVLKPGGYISTRCFASKNMVGRWCDFLRLQLGRMLTVRFYAHSLGYLMCELNKAGFTFTVNPFVLPTLNRFTLVKNQKVTPNRYAVVVNADKWLLPEVFADFYKAHHQKVFYFVEVPFRGDRQYLRAHLRIFSHTFLFEIVGKVLGKTILNLPFLPLGWKRKQSLRSMCRYHNLFYKRVGSVNDAELRRFFETNHVNVVLSFCSDIYRSQMLTLPDTKFFNFHPSLLPNNKGRFPLFWALRKGEPLGITCHRITPALDSGPILFQEELCGEQPKTLEKALVAYIRRFPQLMEKAMEYLESNKACLPQNRAAAYYGPCPGKADIMAYKQVIKGKNK